jgi:hypothetical protein
MKVGIPRPAMNAAMNRARPASSGRGGHVFDGHDRDVRTCVRDVQGHLTAAVSAVERKGRDHRIRQV